VILENKGKGPAFNLKILGEDGKDYTGLLKGRNSIYPGDVFPLGFEPREGLFRIEIKFGSVLDPEGNLFTRVELGRPPFSEIKDKNWI
ncbi:MAG: hypothetical protein ABIJ46_00565, partial [bacterium]